MSLQKKILLFLASLFSTALILFIAYQFKSPYYGFLADSKTENLKNKIFEISKDNKDPVFLYFGFTKCKVSCPISFGILKQISDKLETEHVQFIFVSIDTKRDTKEELEKFTKNFDSRFRSYSASGEVVKEIAGKFSVNYDEQLFKDKPNYQIHHTSHIYLIQPFKNKMLIYPSTFTDSDKIIKDFHKFQSDKN